MKNRRKVRLSLSVEKTSYGKIKISRLRFGSKPKGVILDVRESMERENLITIDWGDFPPGVKKRIWVNSMQELRVIREGIIRNSIGIAKKGKRNGKQRQNKSRKSSRKMS